jgi:hypothetical protein
MAMFESTSWCQSWHPKFARANVRSLTAIEISSPRKSRRGWSPSILSNVTLRSSMAAPSTTGTSDHGQVPTVRQIVAIRIGSNRSAKGQHIRVGANGR